MQDTSRAPTLSAAGESHLTPREDQTLKLIAAGHSNKQIAKLLGISEGTVKIFVRNLLRKFDLASRLELAAWVHCNEGIEVVRPGDVERTFNVAALVNELPLLFYVGSNDQSWKMSYVSEGCAQLTGYSCDTFTQSVAGAYGSLIVPKYKDYVWEHVQQALSRNESFRLAYQICTADGRLKNVYETGRGIYSPAGRVVGIEGAIFEV